MNVRIGNQKSAHLYEIQVKSNQSILVDANNRNQAARIAEKAGYRVMSVNMIG
jgi:hypothetical protein